MKNKLAVLLLTVAPVIFCSCSKTGGGGKKTEPDGINAPILSDDGKTVTYGFYPTSWVLDYELSLKLDELKETRNSKGMVAYEGETYYYGADSLYRDTGCGSKERQTENLTRWFKCEKIQWDVLAKEGDQYLVWSKYAIDGGRYTANPQITTDYQGHTVSSCFSNNYMFSEVRRFLNVDFYNFAFVKNEKYIQTSTVDNSEDSSVVKGDKYYSSYASTYACENTQDKIFILSSKELTNSNYGFDTTFSHYGSEINTPSRIRKNTDYALSVTGWTNDNGAAAYFTRTPGYDSYGTSAMEVTHNGSMGYNVDIVGDYSRLDYIPAMRIKI